MASNVLVTGGAGYVGAHIAQALHRRGYQPVVFDNLRSGFREAVRWGPLIEGDILDHPRLARAVADHEIAAVIHCASLIEVADSIAHPDLFWASNVEGTESVLKAVKDLRVPRLVFSSSAAVYGDPSAGSPAISESAETRPVNPYGETKLACERMIAAEAQHGGYSAVAFRYFNAAGADPSGLIGEAHDPETHLIPRAIAAALAGEPLTINGVDFPTPDGTCVRDFVHVADLADAHVAALELDLAPGAFEAFNLGGEVGRSVTEVLDEVERATGRPVHRRAGPRRPGDPAVRVADCARARRLLGWKSDRSRLEQIVAGAVRWETAPAYGRGLAARSSS